MNKEISKIIFRKNADGTTTKVLVKKVQKNIKLKPKASNAKNSPSLSTTSAVSSTSNAPTHAGNTGKDGFAFSKSQNYKKQRDPRHAKPEKKSNFHTPIVPKNSSFSANNLMRQPQSGAAEHKILDGGVTAKKNTRSKINALGPRENSKNRAGRDVFSLQAMPPSAEKNNSKRHKIVISKKKTENIEKGKSGQFYRRGDKAEYLGEKRGSRKSFQNLEKTDREKRVVDELAGVPKEIEITEVIAVKDLAKKLNLKASTVMKRVFNLGVMNLTLNDNIDSDSAQIVCAEFGCAAKVVSLRKQTKIELEKGKEEDYIPRAPIVTVMGHVDHGKTTLLDALRGTEVALNESGKITQHIGATRVKDNDDEILFIDTPGHAAFSSMRSRGAKITDIVVLVVSAVDGVKPQTEEAINHIKSSECGLIVAVNKTDLPDANLEKVRTDLSKYEVVDKAWGGETPFYSISALKKTGLNELLQGIISMAKTMDVKGNPKINAYGYVIESKVDIGRGNTASVVITNGTLRRGQSYICGKTTGRIRALFDENNRPIKIASPSSAVEIIGLSQLISSGELFQVTHNEKEAKKIAEKRLELEREEQAARVNLVSLSNLFDKIQEENIKELRLIIKSDTFGSSEAIQNTLETLKNDEIKANVVHSAVGAVNENDINLAFTTNAEIVAFKVTASEKIKKLATEKSIAIKYYDVIYSIVEDIKEGLTDILGDKLSEIPFGKLEIKNIFKISGAGKIAGCEVTEGKITNKNKVRVVRDGKVVHTGVVATLRRFKDEAKEVVAGEDCGLSLKNFQNFKVGDMLECFDVKKVKKQLEIEEV